MQFKSLTFFVVLVGLLLGIQFNLTAQGYTKPKTRILFLLDHREIESFFTASGAQFV